MDTQARPEYRCMTPAEIAEYVRDYREKGGLKQVALANRAGLKERTIQRLERGETVSDDTLRAVASALCLSPEAFIGPRLIRTEEQEAMVHLMWKACFTEVTLKPVTDWRAFDELMLANGMLVDDSKLSAEDAAIACGIHDYIAGLSETVSTMTYAERIQEAKKLLEMLSALSANGIRARYVVSETVEGYRIGHLALVHEDDEMADNLQMLVPNSYEQYGDPDSMAMAEAYARRLAHYRSVDALGGGR